MAPRDLESRNETTGLANGRSRGTLGVLKVHRMEFLAVNKEEVESQTTANGKGVSVGAWWGTGARPHLWALSRPSLGFLGRTSPGDPGETFRLGTLQHVLASTALRPPPTAHRAAWITAVCDFTWRHIGV
ncbi:hypothetical protein CLCR_09267 [Cladophialophora carrionii]|uniref:Uncharacterized protein n=1 Tax=Cladophialophora carrionii TaxID=86049 RepID=A0A1C1CSZ8_9EURO|nr:hypothetical protein CLCR_09267 [Cladophialophora carrionii]